MSDEHGRKEQEWDLGSPRWPYASPIRHLGKVGEEPSYTETKEREAGRVADEAVVPVKLWKHNGGKGLC